MAALDKSRIRCAVVTGFMLMTLSAAAVADGSAGNPEGAFSVHDRDRDGVLGREEYALLLQQLLRHRPPGRPEWTPPSFNELDVDGDRQVSEEELGAALARRQLRRRQRARGSGPGQAP